ncbi:unnamed protein product [Rhizophagus irregularis]|nr:unnamed protein product [Rhizophagus irregularis]
MLIQKSSTPIESSKMRLVFEEILHLLGLRLSSLVSSEVSAKAPSEMAATGSIRVFLRFWSGTERFLVVSLDTLIIES